MQRENAEPTTSPKHRGMQKSSPGSCAFPCRATGALKVSGTRTFPASKIADLSLLPAAHASGLTMRSRMVDCALIVEPAAALGERITQSLRKGGREWHQPDYRGVCPLRVYRGEF